MKKKPMYIIIGAGLFLFVNASAFANLDALTRKGNAVPKKRNALNQSASAQEKNQSKKPAKKENAKSMKNEVAPSNDSTKSLNKKPNQETSKESHDEQKKSVPDSTKKEEKASKKKKHDPKLLERINKVFRFGNSRQVRDSLNRFQELSVAEQKSFLPQLKELTNSNDALIRRKMAEIIGDFEFNDLDEELTKLFVSGEDVVFFTVVASITKKKPASALPALREKIKSADYIQLNNKTPDLIRLAGVYQDREIKPYLIEKLEDAETYYEYRGAILAYLGVLKNLPPENMEKIRKIAFEQANSITLRSMAVYALGEQKDISSVPSMKKELDKIDNMSDIDEKKKYLKLRLQIISALVKMNDTDVEKLLTQMARDDDEAIRVRAIRSMGELPFERVKDLLDFKSKYDPSPRVQKEAKKIMEKNAKASELSPKPDAPDTPNTNKK